MCILKVGQLLHIWHITRYVPLVTKVFEGKPLNHINSYGIGLQCTKKFSKQNSRIVLPCMECSVFIVVYCQCR